MQPRKPVHRSVLRVALGVAVLLALPAIAMQFDDGADWSPADFVLAGVLLSVIGAAIELAVRKSGNLVMAIGIAALGVAAIALGQGDDAPGLVLLGLLLVAGGCAMGVRRVQQSR
jgi:peptidoglycan/LPS O-acetylase OafA/YrhL